MQLANEVSIIRQFRRRKAQCGAGVAFHPLVERGGERDAHSPRHRRSALSSGGGLSGRCAPLTARYLPVGSGHSTLIKVSSIRSDGIGNRSITRACIVHPLGSPAPSSNASKHPFLIDIPRYSSSSPLAGSLRSRVSVACVGKGLFLRREEEA